MIIHWVFQDTCWWILLSWFYHIYGLLFLFNDDLLLLSFKCFQFIFKFHNVLISLSDHRFNLQIFLQFLHRAFLCKFCSSLTIIRIILHHHIYIILLMALLLQVKFTLSLSCNNEWLLLLWLGFIDLLLEVTCSSCCLICTSK